MSDVVMKVVTSDHGEVGPESDLDQILAVVLSFKEGHCTLNDTEFTALRLWALQRACRLRPNTEVTVQSEERPELIVKAGLRKSGKVYFSDSEFVYETDVSSIVFLR